MFIPEAEGPGLCLPGLLCGVPTAGPHARGACGEKQAQWIPHLVW